MFACASALLDFFRPFKTPLPPHETPNTLLTQLCSYAKLGDFGFAKYVEYGSRTFTFCGTPGYGEGSPIDSDSGVRAGG